MHPMDTLRLRLQVGDSSPSNLKKYSLVPSSSIRHLMSLYSGYSVAVGFTIPGLAVFLTSYDITKATIARYTSLNSEHTLNHCVSGFIAQGLAGLIFNPMEVVKGYMQTRNPGAKPPLIRQIVSSVYRNQGLTGFFRGYWLAVAVFGPHNIIYFSAYEKMKSLIKTHQDNSPLKLQHFLLASSVATLFGATVTHPIDVLRARYQIYNTSRSMVTNTSLAAPMSVHQYAMHIWRTEGKLRPFMRGITYRIGYLVPNTALSMTMFELFKPLFLQLHNGASLADFST